MRYHLPSVAYSSLIKSNNPICFYILLFSFFGFVCFVVFSGCFFLERTQIKMFLDPFGSTMFVCNKISFFYFIFFIKLDFRIFQYSYAFHLYIFHIQHSVSRSLKKMRKLHFFQGLTLSNRTCHSA